MNNGWFHLDNPDQLDSPALVVYPARVKENIRLAIKMVGGDPSSLRPHVKTHKSPGATRLLRDAGITKFKCATIAEAEMLASSGAPDILLAYQPIGPKLQRYISLIREYPSTKFACLIDNDDAATEMDHAFSAAGLRVPVYIDLNLGMNRTGISPGSASRLYSTFSQPAHKRSDPAHKRSDPAHKRSDTAHQGPGSDQSGANAVSPGTGPTLRSGIAPIGLHAYDGHIRDTDMDMRTRRCDTAFAEIQQLRDQLKGQGLAEPIIVAGGSPTFSIHCKRKAIECSPGTFVYWDMGYMEGCPEQHFLPAALVITRVISLPDSTKLCLDLGHKSIAAENELARRVSFLNAPTLVPIGQSEEHLVVDAGPGHEYRIGDLFYGLPFHICPTVALYERAITIADGLVTGEWMNSARDRKLRF